MVVKPGSGIQYFPGLYKTGDTLLLNQWMWSTKECTFNGLAMVRIIMGDSDRIVDCNCGPLAGADTATYRLGISVSYVQPGSRYWFQAASRSGNKEDLYITNGGSVNYFSFQYHQGDTARVNQLEGPRTVNFTPWPPIFSSSDLLLNADVGGPPAKTKLAGTYSGPAGSRITIRSGANEELTITAPSTGSTNIGFRFPKEYDAGTAYSVNIKTAPPNCNCAIFSASSGTMPLDSSEFSIICNPAVELVSRSTDNKVFNTFYETANPVVGGKGGDEGRYVAFVSSGTGLDGSSGKFRQIFLRDMRSGITKLISRTANGSEGNGNSFAPSISADGRSVAFESYATNLSAEDNNNGVRDVYVWKEGRGLSLVSKGSGGTGNSESYEPSISGDGSVIAFSSGASNLTPGVEGNSIINVYVADRTGQIQLLTKDIKTQKGIGGSAPSISEDGNKVVFCSYAYTLVQNDNNNLWDIFLWQRGMPILKKISMTSSGGDRDQGTESASRVVAASISGNGNYIVYSTTATNMVNGDNNKLQDIFICNIGGGGVRRLSVTANNTEGDGDSPMDQGGRIGISYDGNWITYNTRATNLGVPRGNIILQNTKTGKIIPVTNSMYNTTERPMVSRYGASVVAGCSEKFDKRFVSSGIFSFFTGPLIQ
jgi:Tol biopolymer transport system component